MTLVEAIFLGMTVTGLLGLVGVYAGYPLLMIFFSRPKRGLPESAKHCSATLIIPAWEENLSDKIENTRQLQTQGIDWPVIVITDRTAPVGLPASIEWILQSVRIGKPASLNEAMQRVQTPIVVFSDANTQLNPEALLHMVRPFADSQVGAVAGEKQLLSGRSNAAGEQIYWRYESVLKRIDTRIHSVIGGAGELFAMRTDLFEPLAADCLLDDLELSWQVIRRGFRIEYAPGAIAREQPAVNLREEAKRKVRIAAGAYQFLKVHSLPQIFSTSKAYGWQFLYRKWFRWVLAPVFLAMAGIGNIGLLLVASSQWVTRCLTGLQGMAYLLALIGGILLLLRVRIGWLAAPFYFLFMHYCQIRGWWLHRAGKQSVIWEKSLRLPSV